MTKKIQVGDKVRFRLFNSVEQSFYGDIQEGEVIEIVDDQFGNKYKVRYQYGTIALKPKEIKQKLT